MTKLARHLIRPAVFILAMLSAAMALPACTTTGTPPTETPTSTGGAGKNVNCGAQVLQETIAAAVPKANTVFATQNQQVAVKSLEQLAIEVGPDALACALQYIAGKFGFDSTKATDADIRTVYLQRRAAALDFISSHGYTFQGQSPPQSTEEDPMNVRAKFRVTSVTKHEGANAQETVNLCAASGPGNEQWSKWTPSGTLMLGITNPDAQGQFEPGKEYFLDFTDATPAT